MSLLTETASNQDSGRWGCIFGKTKMLSLYRIRLGVNGEVSTTAESFTIYLSLEFAERRGIMVVKIMKWW